jgi:hypothetical protein
MLGRFETDLGQSMDSHLHTFGAVIRFGIDGPGASGVQ